MEAQLEAEGKTWDDLNELILEEVKAVRKERSQRKSQS